MSKQIDLTDFSKNVIRYLSVKVPAEDVADFVLNNQKLVNEYVNELNLAINSYNYFRQNLSFPNQETYVNSIELSEKFKQDLPKFSLDVSEIVYQDMSTNTYFKRIWQV